MSTHWRDHVRLTILSTRSSCRVSRDAIEDEAHPVEQSRTKCAREALPWADADLRAPALELSLGVDLLAAASVLESDEESFRAVSCDVNFFRAQPEVIDDGVLQVARRGVGWDAHGPGDQGISLPVPQLAFQLE